MNQITDTHTRNHDKAPSTRGNFVSSQKDASLSSPTKRGRASEAQRGNACVHEREGASLDQVHARLAHRRATSTKTPSREKTTERGGAPGPGGWLAPRFSKGVSACRAQESARAVSFRTRMRRERVWLAYRRGLDVEEPRRAPLAALGLDGHLGGHAAAVGHELVVQPAVLGRLVLEDFPVAVHRRRLGRLRGLGDKGSMPGAAQTKSSSRTPSPSSSIWSALPSPSASTPCIENCAERGERRHAKAGALARCISIA